MNRLSRACVWLPSLIRNLASQERTPDQDTDVYFCFADHYEPGWRGADLSVQRNRVRTWLDRYPELARRHHDAEGRSPQHSFFFPAEEYQAEHLDALASLCHAGWGDVEVHLHHDHDTPARFREQLLEFAQILHGRHGLLRKNEAGAIQYGFIHGNWVLNDYGRDGEGCGVNDETSILMETGCYADFTMPCAPHPAQCSKVNSIYYTLPSSQPRAHDSGVDSQAGKATPRGLLMIQGPLNLNWSSRKWGVVPRIENADVSCYNPPRDVRIALWLSSNVHVIGAPQHVFIKVSTHGAQEANMDVLFSSGFENLWSGLERLSRMRLGYRLHYVTAFEMFRKVKEIEDATSRPVLESLVEAQPG
jgi:hypothetical protein